MPATIKVHDITNTKKETVTESTKSRNHKLKENDGNEILMNERLIPSQGDWSHKNDFHVNTEFPSVSMADC